MKTKIIVLLAVETGLALAMAFFGGYRELQEKHAYLPQILWRMALALPVFLMAFDSVFSKPARYKYVMAAALVLVLAADITFIFRFEAGLAVFMLVHLLNTVNFTMLSKKISAGPAASAAAAVILGYVLYKTTLESRIESSFMKVALQLYMLAILASFWRALETAGAAGKTFTALISAGTLVFFAGDYFVARDAFLGEKYHQIINNLLYYTPQVLLAVSCVYYEPEKGNKIAVQKRSLKQKS